VQDHAAGPGVGIRRVVRSEGRGLRRLLLQGRRRTDSVGQGLCLEGRGLARAARPARLSARERGLGVDFEVKAGEVELPGTGQVRIMISDLKPQQRAILTAVEVDAERFQRGWSRLL
jgi:xanthine/CO dehydrogenase XdhC/CoxF family maturation factor